MANKTNSRYKKRKVANNKDRIQLVYGWEGLAKIKPNSNFAIKVNLDKHNAQIIPTKSNKNCTSKAYLSTHAFYPSSYQACTNELRRHGFNVQLMNSYGETRFS